MTWLCSQKCLTEITKSRLPNQKIKSVWMVLTRQRRSIYCTFDFKPAICWTTAMSLSAASRWQSTISVPLVHFKTNTLRSAEVGIGLLRHRQLDSWTGDSPTPFVISSDPNAGGRVSNTWLWTWRGALGSGSTHHGPSSHQGFSSTALRETYKDLGGSRESLVCGSSWSFRWRGFLFWTGGDICKWPRNRVYSGVSIHSAGFPDSI